MLNGYINIPLGNKRYSDHSSVWFARFEDIFQVQLDQGVAAREEERAMYTQGRDGEGGKIGILKFWVARCKKKPQRAANGCGTLVTQFRRGHKRVFGDIEPWDATYLRTDRPTNQPTDRSCLTFSLLLPSFSFFQPPVFSCPFHSALLRPYLRLSCIFAYPRIVRIASWIGIRKSTPIPYNNKTKKKRKQIPNYPSETFLFCKNLWSVADRLWPKIKIIT